MGSRVEELPLKGWRFVGLYVQGSEFDVFMGKGTAQRRSSRRWPSNRSQ